MLLSSFQANAQPFGKDSDLVSFKPYQRKSSPKGLSALAGKIIYFHQHYLSPTDGPRSHYYPSSSQYALNAIKKYGFLYGFILGTDRLMRENDEKWIYRDILTRDKDILKYDPVR
jgi:uncharacterized protein